MALTVGDLLERLQELAALDEELLGREVYFAHQPSWPLQSTVAGVCTSEEAHGVYEFTREGVNSDGEPIEDPDHCVYLVEGSQVYDRPYAPRGAWDQV